MPIGAFAAVPLLAEALLRCRPRSVLDLGLGFGGNGVVVRQWLDLGVLPWKTYLVGVEVWAEYRNPVWDLYDAVHVQTIEQYLAAPHEQFDAVLLGDVLEHFEKASGLAVLMRAKSHVAPGGKLWVTTPARFHPQGAVYGNPWETHRSLWTADDLQQAGCTVLQTGSAELPCLFAEWQA